MKTPEKQENAAEGQKMTIVETRKRLRAAIRRCNKAEDKFEEAKLVFNDAWSELRNAEIAHDKALKTYKEEAQP